MDHWQTITITCLTAWNCCCLADKGFRRDIHGLSRVWYTQAPRDFKPAKIRLIDRALLRCEELKVDPPHRTWGAPRCIKWVWSSSEGGLGVAG